MAQQKGLTLVLGTGLLKMAAAIGVVQVLAEANIPINSVIGASTGAIYAAMIALGFSVDQMQHVAMELGSHYASILGGNVNSVLPPSRSLFSGRLSQIPHQAILQDAFQDHTFADAQLPLQLVVTNFLTGQRSVINQGVLLPWLWMSGSIPGLVPPIKSGGQLFTDGALSDPLPISTADQNNPIIVMVGFELTPLNEIKTPMHHLYQTNTIMIRNLLSGQIALNSLTAHNEIVHLNPRLGVVVDIGETKYIPFIAEKGAEAAQQIVPYLKNVLS
jgi:NTE family protein